MPWWFPLSVGSVAGLMFGGGLGILMNGLLYGQYVFTESALLVAVISGAVGHWVWVER
jgi:hypothetical protein